MNSPTPPNFMFLDSDQIHHASEIVDALYNLLYLVQLDAFSPEKVKAYAEQSETLLLQLQGLMSENSGYKANPVPAVVKPKALVVDDERVVVKTLGIIFSNAGYETRVSESAEQTLAMLKAEDWVPQFALIDVHLPGMNGIDLAIRLRAEYPEMRVSLFSGRAETTELVEEARRQGHLFNVLAKPVHPSVLLGMAARLIGGDSSEGSDPVQWVGGTP